MSRRRPAAGAVTPAAAARRGALVLGLMVGASDRARAYMGGEEDTSVGWKLTGVAVFVLTYIWLRVEAHRIVRGARSGAPLPDSTLVAAIRRAVSWMERRKRGNRSGRLGGRGG